MRENLPAHHPFRRFLAPFTYMAISVNDNAHHNLMQPGIIYIYIYIYTHIYTYTSCNVIHITHNIHIM